jgi:hypothetical protein
MLVCELIFKLSDFKGIKAEKNKVPKIWNFICCLPRSFLRILWKYPFFVFIWPSLRLKLIYIHKNKVNSMFPSNFIREIKKLVFCGTVIFCGTYTCMSINDGRNNYCLFFSLTLHVFRQKIFCKSDKARKENYENSLNCSWN